VSKAFEGLHFTDRASLVLRILWRARALPNADLDLLCYTPEEFEKKKEEKGIIREKPQSMGNRHNSLGNALSYDPPHSGGASMQGPELLPPGHLGRRVSPP